MAAENHSVVIFLTHTVLYVTCSLQGQVSGHMVTPWSVVSGQFGQTDQLVINETTTPTHMLVTWPTSPPTLIGSFRPTTLDYSSRKLFWSFLWPFLPVFHQQGRRADWSVSITGCRCCVLCCLSVRFSLLPVFYHFTVFVLNSGHFVVIKNNCYIVLLTLVISISVLVLSLRIRCWTFTLRKLNTDVTTVNM